MMTFMSVLKRYKRKNAWEEGGSKSSKSEELYPLGTEVCPSTGLARNFYNWENQVFSYCFTLVGCFQLTKLQFLPISLLE